jgi:HAD superfamily hydrolase (TIGR01509 family)
VAFLSYLFDYNGVLVDDELVHLAAFRDVVRPLGIDLSEAEYTAKYLGYDDVGAFRAILRDYGLEADDARVRSLVEAKKPEYLRRARSELKTFPGAGELLRRLAQNGAVVGIVSGALREEIELGLRALGAEQTIRFVVSAEDTRACKPDPEGYLIGRARLASISGPETVDQALVIEDSLAGIEAARAAQLPCLAVAHSYEESQLWAAGATGVVANLADISDPLLTDLANRFRAKEG